MERSSDLTANLTRDVESTVSRRLLDYVRGDVLNAKPLVLTGARGTGKTALLGQLLDVLKAESPDLKIFATLGDEARDRDLREIVRTQCLGLRQVLNLDIPVGHEWGSLLESFRRILVRIPEGIRVLLIVDGLEQMQLPPPAYFWQWLPWTLKPSVRWIFGLDTETSSGPTLNQWLQRRGLQEIAVEPWSDADVHEYARKHTTEWPIADNALAANLALYPALHNPLFLRLYLAESAFSEPRRPLSLRELLPFARRMPSHADFREIYVRLLERWEECHDASTIRELLMLPSCARDGLSYLDIRELMQGGRIPLPTRELWDRVFPHLSPVHHGRYRPVTPLADAVRERYSIGKTETKAFHHRLWKYFRDHENSERRNRELAWQAVAAEDWPGLMQSLVDRELIRFLWGRHRSELLTYWELLLEHDPEALHSAYGEVLKDPRRHFLQLATVARLHGELGRYDEAKNLLHHEEHLCRQDGAWARLSINLGYQATLAELQGDPRAAESILRKQEETCTRVGDLTGFTSCLRRRGILLAALGEFSDSLAVLGKLLQLANDLGDREQLATALDVQAQVLASAGQDAQALAVSQKQEEICRESGNVTCLARSLGRQATLRIAGGDFKIARRLLDEQRPLCEWIGEPVAWAQCLANLALIAHSEGAYAESAAWLELKEQVSRESGDAVGVASTLATRAGLLAGKLKQPRAAVALADEALALARRVGMQDLEHQLERLLTVLRSHVKNGKDRDTSTNP